jgi:putative SOS response-associated peptidase YedK
MKLDPEFPAVNFAPRWNLPPTENLLCVIRDRERGTRKAGLMRWGLIPHYARDPKIGFSSFNARAESLETKPAFRDAWKAGHPYRSSSACLCSRRLAIGVLWRFADETRAT